MRVLPGSVRGYLGLEDELAVNSRRIEIGGGRFPQAGYIHVDLDPTAGHLEALAGAGSLPFESSWASEIVAVHSLEHIPARELVPTLKEWHRVLAPGGRARVHVPNTPELMQAWLDAAVDDKWKLMGALLGMYPNPGTRGPAQLVMPADHQVLFDFDLLSWALTEAGFSQVSDLTTEVVDRHTEAWRGIVPHCSLVAEAVKPAPAPLGARPG